MKPLEKIERTVESNTDVFMIELHPSYFALYTMARGEEPFIIPMGSLYYKKFKKENFDFFEMEMGIYANENFNPKEKEYLKTRDDVEFDFLKYSEKNSEESFFPIIKMILSNFKGKFKIFEVDWDNLTEKAHTNLFLMYMLSSDPIVNNFENFFKAVGYQIATVSADRQSVWIGSKREIHLRVKR